MTIRTISLALTLSLGLVLTGCNGSSGSQAPDFDPATAVPTPEAGGSFTIPSGRTGVPPIQIDVLAKGDGMEARSGDTVAMHYVGTFLDGKQFDSSRDTGQAFEFRLGTGGVISGWDLVVERMHVGDRWKAMIPSPLAYGSRGALGAIPADTDLVFDMELLRVR